MGRLAALASRCRLSVCVDTAENVLQLERAAAALGSVIHCLVEYEVGMRRCGVETHDEVLALAQFIAQQPHLVFGGIQAYAGNMAHEPSLAVRCRETERIEGDLAALREKLVAAGLPPREIGGVSTGTVETKPANSVYTAMQCGSYIFMDRAYRDLELCFENALFLLTTVVSVKPDRIVTDGGVKSLGSDQGDPVFVGFEGLPINMSEEHGQVTAPGHGLQVGDKLRYIPGHCCTTVNCHDRIYLVDGDRVVDIWPVTSRGKAQ